MPRQNIIVCAVDGSEASKTAVKWAANTAVKRGEPLRLVSSYSMPQFLYAEGMVPPLLFPTHRVRLLLSARTTWSPMRPSTARSLSASMAPISPKRQRSTHSVRPMPVVQS